MAVAASAYAEITTRLTTQATAYADITGAALASGDFVAGRKYLLVAMGQFDYANADQNAFVRALHGSTPFGSSEFSWQPNVAVTHRQPYFWWTVWTAVTGEGIKLQWMQEAGATDLGGNIITLFALDLSDMTEGTDWHFAEDFTPPAISTAYQTGASVTFTPATAGHEWLILTLSQVSQAGATTSMQSRPDVSGGTTASGPEAVWEGEDAGTLDKYVVGIPYVLALPATSHTIAEQTLAESAGAVYDHSKVFALDLNRFTAHDASYTAAFFDAVATSGWSDLIAAAGVTPTTVANAWCMTWCTYQNTGGAGTGHKARMQVDGADAPDGQQTANYFFQHNWDGTDKLPFGVQARLSLSAAAHTVELEGHVGGVAAGRGWGQRFALMLPLELAAGGGGTETVLPDATLDLGGWTVTGAATAHEALADEDAGSYVQSPANPVNATLKLGLDITGTPGAGDITIEIDAEQVP